jgi:hypothetical protein
MAVFEGPEKRSKMGVFEVFRLTPLLFLMLLLSLLVVLKIIARCTSFSTTVCPLFLAYFGPFGFWFFSVLLSSFVSSLLLIFVRLFLPLALCISFKTLSLCLRSVVSYVNWWDLCF